MPNKFIRTWSIKLSYTHLILKQYTAAKSKRRLSIEYTYTVVQTKQKKKKFESNNIPAMQFIPQVIIYSGVYLFGENLYSQKENIYFL